MNRPPGTAAVWRRPPRSSFAIEDPVAHGLCLVAAQIRAPENVPDKVLGLSVSGSQSASFETPHSTSSERTAELPDPQPTPSTRQSAKQQG